MLINNESINFKEHVANNNDQRIKENANKISNAPSSLSLLSEADKMDHNSYNQSRDMISNNNNINNNINNNNINNNNINNNNINNNNINNNNINNNNINNNNNNNNNSNNNSNNSNNNNSFSQKNDEVEVYVENMLNELKNKIQNLSNNLLNKVENMEKSLEELENIMINYSNKPST
ncbi:heat shock factor-binding protein 1 [Hepatocystis sp. ex Piliocolobus tephrosceles]|nr:heat shock factor-binding protein 1 [Hepatocystis sp. ex Piliocolobus tephrosceles]